MPYISRRKFVVPIGVAAVVLVIIAQIDWRAGP